MSHFTAHLAKGSERDSICVSWLTALQGQGRVRRVLAALAVTRGGEGVDSGLKAHGLHAEDSRLNPRHCLLKGLQVGNMYAGKEAPLDTCEVLALAIEGAFAGQGNGLT